MADPFLGEIRMFSFAFPPRFWALCNGQFLPINQNQALFSLLGTTYGGNGQTTFALPDLRGRAPMHEGSGHTLGEKAGTESVTLNIQQLPTHAHTAMATNVDQNRSPDPAGRFLGPANNLYAPSGTLTALQPGTLANIGASQAHANMQPFLTISFCIALIGIFPSQN